MGETRFIVAGTFIDGSGVDVRRNALLTVKDTIITAIDSAANLPRINGAAIDDFSHCTILPALVDCSVSLSRSPSVDKRVRLSAEKAGNSREETIGCASENGAGFFGMEKLGTLTVGRKAIFLITRGTANQLPRKLSYLEGIYVDGAPSITYRKKPVKTA